MQKYNKGDHVKVAKDLGSMMSHFTNDCEAIVVYSYDDRYGGGNTKSYSLFIKDGGECSWYEERQLELIEAGRVDLLEEWREKLKKEIEGLSDLDWIFTNGEDVIKNPRQASLQALADCIGAGNLWGSRGEGFDLHINCQKILEIARPFLVKGDKQGFMNLKKM